MRARAYLISWILPFGVSACAFLLIPRPLPSFYSTGNEEPAWALLQVMVFLGAVSIMRWPQSVLLTRSMGFKSSSFRGALAVLRLVWRTKIWRPTLLASVAGLAIVTYLAITGAELFPYSVQYTLTLVIVNAIVRLHPPVVLVFTGSDQTDFIEAVCKMVWPHRVAALLSNQSLGMTMWFTQMADNLRNVDKADWHDTVRRLVDVALLVIVDTRVPGDALRFETDLMLEPSRVSKAVFVTGNYGESTSLNRLIRTLADGRRILIATTGELPALLRRLGFGH